MLFFPESRKKRLDKQAQSSLSPPHCFLPCSTGFLMSRVSKFSIFRRKGATGGVGWGGERTSGLFVKSFLPAFWKKQHRNIFSNRTGRLAKFGWILTYLKISVEMAVTRFLPGAIQLLTLFKSILNIYCEFGFHTNVKLYTLSKTDDPNNTLPAEHPSI